MRELSVAAQRENVNTVIDFISAILDEFGCDDKIKIQFAIAVDEIFINIASYAYSHNDGTATVRCYANGSPPEVKIEFIDNGREFNPLEKEDPNLELSLEKMQVGGLGIFMVKQMMDTVEYERQGTKNILTITKNIRRML